MFLLVASGLHSAVADGVAAWPGCVAGVVSVVTVNSVAPSVDVAGAVIFVVGQQPG